MMAANVLNNCLTTHAVADLKLDKLTSVQNSLHFRTITVQQFTIITIRASNRLKYRSGLGSGSTKFIFSGLPPVQVFHRLILRV